MEENKTHEDFEPMILSKIKELSEPFDEDNIPRIQQAVTLEFRNRGNYFGVFNFHKQYQLEWVGELGKGLVTFPVIPRAIRSKSATSLATETKLSIEVNRRLPEIEAAREIAESIYDRIERELWNEDFEININHLRQTQRRVYYEFFWNKEKGISYDKMQRSEESEEISIHGKMYACANCGEEVEDKMLEESEVENPEQIEENSELQTLSPQLPPCPFCQAENSFQISQEAANETINPLKSVSKKTGDLDVKIKSALLTRIDDYSAIGGEFERARWFNFNDLLPCYEVKATFSKLGDKLGNSNIEKWSPGTMWHYALSKENGNYHNSARVSQGYKNGLRQFYEVQRWFLVPEHCHGWKCPNDVEFDYEENGKAFTIKKEETIEEAMKRNLADWGEKDANFDCLCVWVANGKVLKIENIDFRETAGMIGWILNPSSYFPQGEERLLNLQDAATNIFSMVYSGGLKQQLASLVANEKYFGESNLKINQTGGIIYVKNSSGTDLDTVNWQNQIFYLSPPQLNEFIWKLADVIIQIQKEESGIYDETVGQENSSNQTASGKNLMVNQSLNLMLSPSKTKKRGKIKFVKKALKMWQKAPDAAFQMVPGTFNEEWKAQDIKAFKNCDIDADLRIEVIEGTDIPKAVSDTQSALLTVYQLGLLAPENQYPAGFVVKLLRALGVKEDYKNTDASKRLAGKRLKIINQKIADIDPLNAFVTTEEPNPNNPEEMLQYEILNPQILMSVMTDPRLQARESENHQIMMEFYADQINGEMGKDVPNKVLLALLDEMVKMHIATLNGVLSKAAASQGMIEGTGEATKAGTVASMVGGNEPDPEAEAERQRMVDDENRNHTSAEAEKQRQHEAAQNDENRKLEREKMLVGTKREFK